MIYARPTLRYRSKARNHSSQLNISPGVVTALHPIRERIDEPRARGAVDEHARDDPPHSTTTTVYDASMLRSLLVVFLLVATAPAHAESVEGGAQGNDSASLIDQLAVSAPGLERIAKGAFRRARRAVSIGPTAGAFAGYFPDAEQADYAITFGLGVEVFKVPILPTPDNIKALVIQRAKAKLLARQLGVGDAKQIAREAWDEAIKELFGVEGIAYKTMERPRFSLAFEGNRFLDGEVWATRLRAGIGISKITLAASFATAFTDPKTSVYTGLEVVTHFMVAKQPRSSVVDVFFRADFEVRNRDIANADFYGVGVRYLLDAF
jgi:hypothetical protein